MAENPKAKKQKPKPPPSIHEVFRSAYSDPISDPNYQDSYNLGRGLMVMNKLMDAYPGLTIDQAAGVAGNLGVESYFNPAIRQGQLPAATGKVLGPGVGLAQWEGPRRDELMKRFPGEKWKDINNQIAFIQQENASTEGKNWQNVLKNTTPEATAESFLKLWERSSKPNLPERKQLARELADSAKSWTNKYIAEQKKKAAQQAAPPKSLWQKFLDGIGTLFD